MKRRVLFFLSMILLTAACHREDRDHAAAIKPDAGANSNAATASTPVPGQTATTTVVGQSLPAAQDPSAQPPDLALLTQALRKASFEHQKLPKSIEEFTLLSGVSLPAPPPGKKFAIDAKRVAIILVNK